MIGPIQELERCLSKLPGLGRRSAGRAALALVREPARLMEPLVAALRAAQGGVKCCSRCGAFTTVDRDPCETCTDATRDGTILCVVEEPADIVSIESSGAFRGRYHALGGKLVDICRDACKAAKELLTAGFTSFAPPSALDQPVCVYPVRVNVAPFSVSDTSFIFVAVNVEPLAYAPGS